MSATGSYAAYVIDSAEQNRLGLGAVSGAVTLMGIGSVVAKAAEIDGPILGFHRAWGAALVYGLLLACVGGKFTVAKLRIAAPGGLVFGIQLAFFFSAIQRTTVANATMLIALQPVVVLLFYCLLYTSPSPRDATLSRMPSSA